ncbi:MAG: gamma-glutamylcyclotransferase [Silicimonas sp.]|nr:gamma-glutamylcyclotransferase [Silicimonas sp.]
MTEEKVFEQNPLWVFGYASLMWQPGFPVAETRLARLGGFSRSFCMASIHHRGTVMAPGLVLALDQADEHACEGLALRVEEGAEEKTITYLRDRELVSSAYVERLLTAQLRDGTEITTLAYVVDREHTQYVPHFSLEEQARIISKAVGGRGPNTEYLWNTADRLRDLGLHDPDLDWLANRVRTLKKDAP